MPEGAPGVVALLSLALDRNSDEPLVRQLYIGIRDLILTHRLCPGTKLPSTRKLSRELQVSRTVTLDAFGQLTSEGFLETRRGSGHFVAPLPLVRGDLQHLPGPPAVARPEPSIWTPRGLPFDPAWQMMDQFPSQSFGRMLGRGWRRHQPEVLERHWAGLPALRQALAQHLHALRGIALTADQVMITAGNSDALRLIARAVRRNDRESTQAWVEDPGLGTARTALENESLLVVPVAVDQEGMRVADGERRSPGAAMALVTPTRQFPLGMPLSLPRRLALLDWARRAGTVVVDDDYDGEIRFTGRPLRSLASLDPAAQVVTLGSFSKLTFPGLRLGYAAGPADLIARLAECRRETYALVPTPAQAALAEFIVTGAFARHLRALRIELTKRRRLLVEALNRHASDFVEILPQEVGMHLSVRLRPEISSRLSDVDLAARARDAKLVLLPLSQQYVRARPEQGFLLGYAGWSETEMEPAIDRLIELFRAAARAELVSS